MYSSEEAFEIVDDHLRRARQLLAAEVREHGLEAGITFTRSTTMTPMAMASVASG
jgi:hypothetical protein